MIAVPIIPGHLYRVTWRGISLIVIAPDGCTAIVIGMARFFDDSADKDAEAIPCAA